MNGLAELAGAKVGSLGEYAEGWGMAIFSVGLSGKNDSGSVHFTIVRPLFIFGAAFWGKARSQYPKKK